MGNFRLFASLGLISVALSCALGASTSLNTIFFRHYNRNGEKTDINIENVTDLIPLLDLDKLTMIYIHGYSESVESDSVKLVTDAYLNATDINVVAIDYKEIAAEFYVTIVSMFDSVASVIGQAFNKLEGSGLKEKKIHVVGHSLGGQLSGQITHFLNFTLPRITGLDPAGPLFYITRFLKSGDATFVDIIHTDKHFYGQAYNSGTVNFLPNYGRRVQPGCPLLAIPGSNEDFCSHHRSWRFYAESVKNPNGFLAVQCDDDLRFQLNLCNKTNIIPMGYGTPTNSSGVYYLSTNSKSPYARGLRGTRS